MKSWHETTALLLQLCLWVEAGRRACLVTVVAIRGSAYRRPGAKLLVLDDGRTDGSISGGCLEADVRERAIAALGDGSPRIVHYDTDDQSVWGLGLGCNGAVDLLLQPVLGPDALAPARAVLELLGGEAPFAVSTVVDGERAGQVLVHGGGGTRAFPGGDAAPDREVRVAGERLLAGGESALHWIGSSRVFTEVQRPPPHLVVFGAGDDAIPLAATGGAAGFRVVVVDHRPAFLTADRFPGARLAVLRPEQGLGDLPIGPSTFAVVKTHLLEHDREWVRALLATDVRYVGVLGPRARTDELLRQLAAAPDERIHAPVGLDLGADGPEQVALSIVAELLAVRAGRAAVELRKRNAPIHG